MTAIVEPNLKRWLYVISLLLLLSVLVGIVFSQQIWAWYTVEQLAPSLQRDLGFTAQTSQHPKLGREVFYISSVSAGGAFATAGVRAGDVPFGYEHAAPAEFYYQLQTHRGGSAVLQFLRPPDREGSPVQLQFTVAVPKRAPSNSG